MLEEIHTIIFDFDGVFTDNKVYVSETGQELVRCDRGDGLAVSMLRRYASDKDLDVFILSTEKNPVVSCRAEKLKIKCHQGVGNKLAHIKAYLLERFPSVANPEAGVVYLGNDLNDYAAMSYVKHTFAPSDAHAKIKEIATEVLPVKGGDGFVRRFIEDKILDESLLLCESGF